MTRSPGEQFERFVAVVREAVAEAQALRQQSLPRAAQAARHEPPQDIPVVTFADLWAQVSEAAREEMRAFADSLTLSQDLRERCRRMAEHLLHKSGRTGPCVVVYFANGIVPKVDSGERVREDLTAVLDAFGQETGERFLLHRYFPYISDLSFLTPSPDGDDPVFVRNFPSILTASPTPARELPTLMVGTYGTGAHQPDECVDVDYTFGRLPALLMRIARGLCQ
jgi:arginine utilization protein RocB